MKKNNRKQKVINSILTTAIVTTATAHENLHETVIIATKFESNTNKVSSSVDFIDSEEVEKEKAYFLQDAIGYRIPGVTATSLAGTRGQLSNLFIRGTSTDQSQVLVDGIRASDSNFGTGFLLSSLYLTPGSGVEILKGSNSAIYGGEATGGVLSLNLKRGEGDPSGSFYFEAGSFNSVLSTLHFQGDSNGLSYNFSVTGEQTSNIESNSDHENLNANLRLDYDLNDKHTIGLTFRSSNRDYETPRSSHFDPVTFESSVVTSESNLDQIWTSIFLESNWSDLLKTQLRVGYQDSDFDLIDALGSKSTTDSERFVISSENQFSWDDSHESIIGGYYEVNEFSSSFSPEADRELFGLYATHIYSPTEDLTFKGSVRWEDYDDFGNETTWSAGLVWNMPKSYVFKANVGTSVRTPTFAELNGIPSFFVPGNPGLESENTTSWDVSFSKDWEFISLAATWFDLEIEDSIGFDPATFSSVNTLGNTDSSGLELSLDWQDTASNLDGYLSYTYQRNDALSASSELSGPRHVIAAGVEYIVNEKLDFGLSANWVDSRSFGGNEVDSFIVVNPYVNYKINDAVALHLRVDNVFNESYLLSDFTNFGDFEFPARSRGVFAGVKVSW